jgi:demethylmenaquinone methyltransferase/2-methoxy-6-polyprenyl-1,4-benzoquinol methylase
MMERRFTPDAAQRFYDALAGRYDGFALFEARARQLALDRLEPTAGQFVLNVGLGTGAHYREAVEWVGERGMAAGIDLSFSMLRVAQSRGITALAQADGAWLPFALASFDRLLCTYVLDLVAWADLPRWLSEFRRVLKPHGCMALVSLTEGVNLVSRVFVAIWKLAYRVSPLACGGCRPLQLAGLVRQAGFERVERQVVLQFGVPSELLLAG